MDEIVKAALRKWPNVPHCYGWLALDARGNWYMRDERVQRAGAFSQLKGNRIGHDKLLEFIHRNYGTDGNGCWFFQNGPQRVYVELEAAPWVWRIDANDFSVRSHTGADATVYSTWLDEPGRLFLDTSIGFGLVHTMDTGVAAAAIERELWKPTPLAFADMPRRFNYVLRPQGQIAHQR